MKMRMVILNLIDWSRSFVDADGSFYCGTTDAQKENTARLVELADLVIFSTDLHPTTSREHTINGGLYPVHNAIKPSEFGPDFIYLDDAKGNKLRLGNRTLSPQLTELLHKRVKALRTGIIVPKQVYFQDGVSKPWCSPEDIEATFGEGIVAPETFILRDFRYIIAPKQYYDATRLDSDLLFPKKVPSRVPDANFNIFSLLKLKYPEDRFELVFVNTGVVEGICRLHTSIGLKQMFHSARVINLTDATTPLSGVGLGYDTPEQSRDACTRVCRDVGVEYMTADEFREKFGKKKKVKK
jgi:nicotinamidase-related amidase